MKRVLPALILLLLLAGAAALFWPSERTSIGRTATFSDGTTMTLHDVTYGTEHRYLGGGWRQRLLSLLPRALAAKFRSRQGVLTTARPSVTFWFERRGNGPPNGYPALVLCDADGFGVYGGHWLMRTGTPTNRVEGWAFESWPRRGRTFTVRLYERGPQYPDAKLVGEFTVRNPKPGKYPVWTAPAPPVTARDGDLSATLFDLVAGVGRGSNMWKPAPNPTVSMARLGFRLERNGRPTTEWGVASVEASDATGNVITRLWGTSSGGDAEYVELQPHLWPAESAWKLRVGFSQRTNFAPAELWTLRGVPLSETEPTNTVAAWTNLQGIALQYTGQARRSWLRGTHHFNFRVTPPGPDYRVTLVKAVDDQGRPAPVDGSYESPNEWAFALIVNTSATRLDLTVALHRTRYLEFLARPQVIATNTNATAVGPRS